MGEYVEQADQLNGRSTFFGGFHNEMQLRFCKNLGWAIGAKGTNLTVFIYSEGTEALPQLLTSGWFVWEEVKKTSPVRVEKFKKRETMLKLSGGQSFGYGTTFEGIYRKQDRIHKGKPTYVHGDSKCTLRAVWFEEGFGWCVGLEKMIGTCTCTMHADDFAPTPDGVQSTWMVRPAAVVDPRMQLVLVPAVSGSIPIPDLAPRQELPSALENTRPPLAIALVGVGEGYSGLYEKQQRLQGGAQVIYKGSRADGNRMLYAIGERWRIGPCGNDGMVGCFISANSSATSPLTIEAVWQADAMVPCSSIRVTKSKKKHTKVIEVKGVPADSFDLLLGQLNGKYRQQAHMIGGRPTFKGGEGGNHAIWYSESAGSWRIGSGNMVGTAVYGVHAKDTASMPNTVKSTWEVMNGRCEPNPYAKIILPTVQAAEQEVPRQMTLKMTEVVTTEQKRCLCCGHQYTSQTEVVYHDECMHHHCVCCEQDQDSGSCAVCAQQEEEG
jgi:hypothetical protein